MPGRVERSRRRDEVVGRRIRVLIVEDKPRSTYLSSLYNLGIVSARNRKAHG
jgi:hypothetical protein